MHTKSAVRHQNRTQNIENIVSWDKFVFRQDFEAKQLLHINNQY